MPALFALRAAATVRTPAIRSVRVSFPRSLATSVGGGGEGENDTTSTGGGAADAISTGGWTADATSTRIEMEQPTSVRILLLERVRFATMNLFGYSNCL